MQHITTLNLPWLGQLGQFLGLVLLAAMVLMQIMLANCVWRDANQCQTAGRPLVILTPFIWMLVALLPGLAGVAFYWVCHYSRFYRMEKPC
ncbi:MAG TPA: hypothetical protein VGO57_00220 [Verrucomicrobiae bacterium]|jgi:hypothetical protein